LIRNVENVHPDEHNVDHQPGVRKRTTVRNMAGP